MAAGTATAAFWKLTKTISKASSLALLLMICFGLVQSSLGSDVDEAAASTAAMSDISENVGGADVEHTIHVLFCAS
jgi:hypothetical protein